MKKKGKNAPNGHIDIVKLLTTFPSPLVLCAKKRPRWNGEAVVQIPSLFSIFFCWRLNVAVAVFIHKKNKAQGQTVPWCVIDVSDPSFSHGQEYVAFSRPNVFSHSAIFCNESDVVDNQPTFINVVYDELMEDDNYDLLENNYDDELMDIENDN